jgi:hypothetical protein
MPSQLASTLCSTDRHFRKVVWNLERRVGEVNSEINVRWNNSRIERNTLLFQTRTMGWQELARFSEERPSGYLWISSYDSPRIRFSPYCNGVGELISTILNL